MRSRIRRIFSVSGRHDDDPYRKASDIFGIYPIFFCFKSDIFLSLPTWHNVEKIAYRLSNKFTEVNQTLIQYWF